MRVLVVNHLSLDGVVQGPGRPGEDTRDGFQHGGWARQRGDDPALGAAMGARMGRGFCWLFGHRSYDEMLTHWNAADRATSHTSSRGWTAHPPAPVS